ncbi:MAG: DUF1127 domain-containing protein [Gammaproteobacteria bacterium]|nr:DUF1127 domain-containing protein [Gammaproteobacteria bacterium]
MSNIFHIHGRGNRGDGESVGDGVGDRGDNIIHTRFRAGGPGAALASLARAWAALRAWNNRRIAVRELSAMPDAQLRDIGIERYQIRDAVNGAYPDLIRLRGLGGAAVAVAETVTEVKQAA